MTDNLVQSQPFSAEIMEKIEEAAVSAAREILSGRRIIDVEGAYGLGLTTVEVGNDDLCREPGPGEASAVLSRALSLPMIYRRFSISKRRIAAFEEMGQPLNLRPAEDAAQAVALREEEFIYTGQPDFHLQGLLNADGRNTLQGGDWSSVDQVLDNVIAAVNILDGKGYRGPYGLALAPALYNNLFRRYPGPTSCRSNISNDFALEASSKPILTGAFWWPMMSALLSSGRICRLRISVPMPRMKILP